MAEMRSDKLADENERLRDALKTIAGGTVDWLDGARDSAVLEKAINIAKRALERTK